MLLLIYENVIVGEITGAFESDRTWFGTFRSRLPVEGDAATRRLQELIEFCIDWHARLQEAGGGDAAEFDRFNDLIYSPRWCTQAEEGEITPLGGAPVFFDSGEITWRNVNQ